MLRARRFPLLPLLLACAGTQATFAQQPAPLEEVIVTATLRAVPVLELPASVTVLGADTVRDGAVQHLEELLPQVPSLSWAGASSRPRYFQLRGIGELEQYQGAPNPSVGFLIDEIDFSGIGMVASLIDVEQVEVLRGPQGTRYGANALAGLIKVKTRDPVAEPGASFELGAGDDGLWSAGVVTGGALPGTSTGAWRAVLQRARSDGFRRNTVLGRDDTNGRDELTARLKLHLDLPRGWHADLSLLYLDFDNGYDAFAIDNSLRTLSDRPGRDAQRSTGISLAAGWRGADGLELRSTTAWADSDIEASFDGDWGNPESWGSAGPYDFFSRTLRGRSTLSEDLRLLSGTGGDWSWLAGLWWLRLEESNRVRDDGLYLDWPYERVLDSDYDATSRALYGQVERAVAPATRVTFGLRLEERVARYTDSDGGDFHPRDPMWGGQVSVTHATSATQSLWLALSRGFKAGGFNIGTAVPQQRRQFEPEYLWSLEAGWKLRGTGRTLAADVNLFYTRREQQQVATSFQLDPQDPLTFLFLTDNAASGEAVGLEGSLRWRATARLELGASGSLLRSRFLGYQYGARNLSGRAWAHAPEWKFATFAAWRHPHGWMARVDWSGTAGFYHDTSHDQRAGSYFLTNLRAGYERERWSLHAWLHNAFDRRYPVRGFWFGNEPPDFPEKLYVRLGDPRQFGVTARYSF
ncbi:MAG: TonB-dependent receptor [Gammaproteobacteria bacterium]|nr:TonB-dependent receptor [Gammaproteobacteria bacterium]